MVETIIAHSESYVSVGLVRSRAARDLDPRTPDLAGRCRCPPDAAAYRTGSQSGHRRRRCIGDRAEPLQYRNSAPRALLLYEQLRRERTAGVQRMSRVSGARYDASSGDLHARDRQLDAQRRERAWVWNYDADAAAAAAAASL